jgi:predicted methyltransferase
MVKVVGEEREVLGYLKVVLDKNQLDGVNSRQIADDLDMPIEKVNQVCQQLENKDLAHIEKRNMEKGDKVKDLVIWIKPRGIESLQKEHGIPL